jgi:hypothetical protein
MAAFCAENVNCPCVFGTTRFFYLVIPRLIPGLEVFTEETWWCGGCGGGGLLPKY